MENEKYDLEWAEERLKEAQRLISIDKFEEASDILNKIKKIFLHLKKWNLLIQCLYEQSRISFDIGTYQEAKEYALEAISLSESKFGVNHKTTALPLFSLSRSHQINGNYKKAIYYLNKGISFLDESDAKLAIGYFRLSSVYKDIANYKAAIKYLKLGLKIDKLKDKTETINNSHYYNALGACYRSLNSHEEAFSYLYKALITNYSSSEENIMTSLIYTNLSVCYFEKENYSKAIELTKKSLKIKSRILKNKTYTFAQNYSNLGIWYQYNKNYSKAFKCYNIAYKIFIKCYKNEQNPGIALLFFNFGSLYIALNEHDSSIKYTKKGINLLKNTSSPNIVVGYNYLGKSYLIQEKIDKSIQNFNKSNKNNLPEFRNSNNKTQSYFHLISKNYFFEFYLLVTYVGLIKAYFTKYLISANYLNLIFSWQKSHLGINLVDNIRINSQSQTNKLLLAQKAQEVYIQAIKVCMVVKEEFQKNPKEINKAFEELQEINNHLKLPRPEEAEKWAFTYSEKSKSFVLFSGLEDQRAKLNTGISQELLDKEYGNYSEVKL